MGPLPLPDASDGPGASKKRRLPGACDICRRRKIKCDSGEMPGNRCSHCISFNFECTRTPRKNELASQKEYIRQLEERVATLEEALKNSSGPQDNSSATRDSSPQNNLPSSGLLYPPLIPPRASPPNDSVTGYEEEDNDDDLGYIGLTQHFNQMELETLEGRFFGPSSAFMLMKNAMMAKTMSLGPAERSSGKDFRRPVYWDIRPWERDYIRGDILNYVYPPPDLLAALVDTYFAHVNVHLPLLHRPTFEKSLAENLHYALPSFGASVLLVCAVGSRHIDDERVYRSHDGTKLASGWVYFSQVPILRNYTLHKADIYDLQYYCLAAVYLFGTSVPNASWIFMGLGFRFAQEEGTHRRKAEGQKRTLEDELWKRAFWFLVCFDRFSSSFLGRTVSIQDEDFDIDAMVECDDEYWECDGLKSEVTFHQPPDKPSTVTGFIYCLRLCEILAFSLRTLYSTKKAKIWSGHVGNEWQHRLVAQINSALDNWKESVPEHLKWDPLRSDPLHFDQSTAIYVVFYYVQMQIHRPLISRDTPISSTSLATCTNAARHCGHLLDIQFKRRPLALPHVVISSFTAGVILLLSVWSGHKDFDPHDDMATIQSCLHTLKVLEPTWHIAGRLWDMLNELARTRQSLPLIPPPSRKRPRGQEQNTYATRDDRLPLQPVSSTSSMMSVMDDPAALSLPPGVDLPHPPMSIPSQHSQHHVPEDAGLPSAHGFPHTSSFREESLPTVTEPTFTNEGSHTDPSYQFPRQMKQIWSQAPTGFDLAEWDVFIANMGRTGKS